MRLFDELRRRNVFRVGAAYVVLGWLVIQVTDTVSPALNLPDWTLGLVTWLGIVGLPFALFFAWAFELTPDGIRREKGRTDQNEGASTNAKRLDVALIGLLALTIGFMLWHSLSQNGQDSASESVSTATGGTGTNQIDIQQSIAVLPLINMSSDTENAYFAGGVHEEILTNLSRIEGSRVVSRTTALRYVDSDLSLRDIGLDLGVRYIVEGSVRRVNNHARITVQLIDAANDAHLWASNFDRELINVFAVQSEVANTITKSLHLEIQPETVGTLDNMPTQSVKAYDSYIKALSIGRSEPESEAALLKQRELLEAATAEDPNFVEAWAMLNEILDHSARNVLQNKWFGDSAAERQENLGEITRAAQASLETAVSLDPDNVETLLAQASNYVLEQESAEYQVGRKQYIDRVLNADPDNATAWLVLGWWHRLTGDDVAATPAFQKALELDPLNARIVDSSLVHFRLIGDQAMTTMLFERLAQIAPEKADLKELGQIHPVAKLENLIVLFGQTADESIVETYANALIDAKAEFAGLPESEKRTYWSRLNMLEGLLGQIRGDIDAILNREPAPLLDDANDYEVFFALWDQANYLAAHKVSGDSAGATAVAEHMLDIYDRYFGQKEEIPDYFQYPMSAAYVELDDQEAIQAVRASLIDLPDETLLGRVSGPFYALAIVDINAAIPRLLSRKTAHPNWHGTDWIATAHVANRHIINHPDMQEFFVNEGKWLDYLAARVPEYAELIN